MPGYQAGMVIDDSNFNVLLDGDGDSKVDETLEDGNVVQVIEVNGHKRYLSRMPRPAGHNSALYSVPYSSVLPIIPESEYKARIDEMNHPLVKRNVNHYDKFAPQDQNGFPSCWRGGTCAAAERQRVKQGNPYVKMSILSLCPNISPRVGGYEGNSVQSLVDIGIAANSVWDSNDPNMSLTNKPEVQQSRIHHKCLKAIEWNSKAEYISGLLLGLCGPEAYDWWSHVIRSGSIGYDNDGLYHDSRNQWGSWGDKNEYGFDGYVRMRLDSNKGMPDSGWFILDMTQSLT